MFGCWCASCGGVEGVWMGNCVGFLNQKFFVCMLAFGCALAVFVMLQNAPFVLELAREASPVEEQSAVVIAVEALVALICFFLTLSLLLTNVFLVSRNRTTIENKTARRRRRVQRALKRYEREHGALNPRAELFGEEYNLGRRKNWLQLFGGNALLWLLPVFTSKGDGFEFEQRASALHHDVLPPAGRKRDD